MRGSVLKARDLGGLRRQIVDRVEDQIDERELAWSRSRGEVSDRHANTGAIGFRTKPRDHRFGEIDAVDSNTPAGQWQCDPTRADPELERTPVTDKIEQEIHRGIDNPWIEDRGIVVVARGDPLIEVTILVHDSDRVYPS